MDQTKAAWTVMVYLAGDNNLTSECMFALTEMKQAKLVEQINVIAEFDPSDPYLPTHRYKINRAGERKDIYGDIFDCARYDGEKKEVVFNEESKKAYALSKQRESARISSQAEFDKASFRASDSDTVITDDTDTGSPVPLYNFISFCIEKYPAERYMVVLSGHAAGTERDYLLKDESSARSLTFNELKQVLTRVKEDDLDGKLIDMVGMDNCLMSMAEICYELRGLTEVVVACESFSPTSGWPYRQILERLSRDFVNPELPTASSVTEEAAKAIVDEYVNYYSTYWLAGLSVTQSALNVCKVEKLRDEVNKLAREMEKALVEESGSRKINHRIRKERGFANSLLLAHWETQSYNGEQYVDLYDLCDCLESRVEPDAVVKQCRVLKEFIRNEFVLKSCYCGAGYQYSYGVSIYFPWAQVTPSYWNLDFVGGRENLDGWGSFLEVYTDLTRRMPRGCDTAPESADIAKANAAYVSAVDNTDYRIMYDRMGSRNRIYSMRNPPDMFLQNEYVKDSQVALEGQNFLRLKSSPAIDESA